MAMIALRIRNEMKREMNKVKINWSEYIRHTIHEVLESGKKRDLIKRVHQLIAEYKSAKQGTAARITRQIRANYKIVRNM